MLAKAQRTSYRVSLSDMTIKNTANKGETAMKASKF